MKLSSLWPRRKTTVPLDLEERVTQKNSDLMPARVKIVEKFNDPEYAARTIWECFKEKGSIAGIGERINFTGKIEGSPELRRAEDGFLYPPVAVFEAKVNNTNYIIQMNREGDTLKVIIECNFKDIPIAESIIVQSYREIVSIQRLYEDLEPLKRLHQFLDDRAQSVKIGPTGFDRTPTMLMDEEFGLLATKARISAVIDGTHYIIHTDLKGLGMELTVECPMDKTEYVHQLLASIAAKKNKEGGREVKSLDFLVSVRDYHWDMVGGLEEIERELHQYVEWPLENPELFRAMDSSMPKGIILIGPPGNGKTTIAKIIANETQSSFYAVSPKDINSMWVGGTEKNWGRLFSQARADVKKGKTVIIFIDEIDGFYTTRDEMDKYSRISFGQFCQEMDGLSDLENVIVLAATNRPEMVDPALMRPGRFTKKIYIKNPNEKGRGEILGVYTKRKPIGYDVDIAYLISETDGFSGADLKELCDVATFNAIERYSNQKGIPIKDIIGDMVKDIVITREDFNLALSMIRNYNSYGNSAK